VILALFSSLTKRYTIWLYKNSHSMTVRICCNAEEEILQQECFCIW